MHASMGCRERVKWLHINNFVLLFRNYMSCTEQDMLNVFTIIWELVCKSSMFKLFKRKEWFFVNNIDS